VDLTGSAFKDKKINRLIEIWKQTVTVQMHFNDIEMRVRNLALTFLAAIIAAIGFIFDKHLDLDIGTYKVDLAGLALIMGIVIWGLFWLMDRFWYHRLLNGSVDHGIAIEEELIKLGVNAGLAKAIKEKSPLIVLGKKID
jgi:hypothetical protein